MFSQVTNQPGSPSLPSAVWQKVSVPQSPESDIRQIFRHGGYKATYIYAVHHAANYKLVSNCRRHHSRAKLTGLKHWETTKY